MHLKPYQVQPLTIKEAFHLLYNTTNIRKVVVHHRFNELQRLISVMELTIGTKKVKYTLVEYAKAGERRCRLRY